MITSKRNKIEMLDDLVDGLVKRHSGDHRYGYRRIDLEDIKQVNPQIAEDILNLHDKRVDVGYTFYTNNPTFDEYIQMGFRIVDFVAKNFDAERGVEYLECAIDILKREEINPFEKGSSFQSFLTEDMYIVKIPLELNEEGKWQNHIWGSVRSAYLGDIIPHFDVEEGIYELHYQGIKTVKFQVFHGELSVIKEDKNFVEYLKTDEKREQVFIAGLRQDFLFYDEYDTDFTFEDFVKVEREKIETSSKYSELHPVFQQFYPLYVEETEDEEDDFIEYDCSNCRDGGCLHCSPQDFL